jgi:hypothetical protein
MVWFRCRHTPTRLHCEGGLKLSAPKSNLGPINSIWWAVRIPSSKLIELGNVDDVVYVEGGDQYSLP